MRQNQAASWLSTSSGLIRRSKRKVLITITTTTIITIITNSPHRTARKRLQKVNSVTSLSSRTCPRNSKPATRVLKSTSQSILLMSSA